VYSPSWDMHLQHLEIAFQILSTNSLFAKYTKCSFGVNQVHYLGHIISAKGVMVDPEKIQTVLNWPIPTTLKALRGFLGFTGYYRKFVQSYGSLAAPLTALLKQPQPFLWTKQADESFMSLKKAMSTSPVLSLPDFSVPFVVECDASGQGMGAVLMQKGKPLAY